jgi:hypothetical protein
MNTKLAYPCLKCSHSEVIDFANPPKACLNCGQPLPKLDLPQKTILPKDIVSDTINKTEVIEDDQD